MSIKTIHLHHLTVPLKKKIKHASHERTFSDNLVVRVTLDDGQVGYGEGVPRPYVTGETIESSFATLSGLDVARHFGAPRDFTEVVRRLEALTIPETEADPRGMAGNAARCALELAVLDAYGRRFGESFAGAIARADLQGLPRNAKPARVRYSGAIMAESDRAERVSAWKMRLYGFAQTKLKVGVVGQDDAARVHRARKILGGQMDLRLDANEAWRADDLVARVRKFLPDYPSSLEQPLPHAEVDALAELRPRLGVKVMLDESLCGWPDGLRAVERKTADQFNVRLSKCGGLLPSLRLAALATRASLGVQLGCHPGETGLLSAAGRHFAGMVRGLRYIEGSYDRHVLAENITREDVTFGYGGWAPPLKGPGLGVRVDDDALARLTVRRHEVRYD